LGRVLEEETWSCYEGGKAHCGQCSACVEHEEAFPLADFRDPIVYETVRGE
jgi:7-cyano-7-deazaguanine synthase